MNIIASISGEPFQARLGASTSDRSNDKAYLLLIFGGMSENLLL